MADMGGSGVSLRQFDTPLAASQGGTGASSGGTNGQILIGSTGSTPVQAAPTVSSELTVTTGAGSLAFKVSLPYYGLIGSISGANLAVTTDQALTMRAVNSFIVRRVIAVRNTGTPILAAGGIYTAASKGGNALMATTATIGLLTGAGKYQDVTLAAIAGTDVQSTTQLYLSLTTANAIAATADYYVFGEILS